MSKAIFTTSESSAYDDNPEIRYHFPRTYYNQVKQAEGNWILYYEPRRTSGEQSNTGRQAYFAMARVVRIEADAYLSGHFYAYVDGYLEFDRPVPFHEGDLYYESLLKKDDGSTNKGAFGRSVRLVPDDEFDLIINAGFTRNLEAWEKESRVSEEPLEYLQRPIIERVVSRKFRDEAFRRHVRIAYSNRCAISGIKLINGGGRPEVQAAHIRSVEADGPDTVRNGLALTGTVHWMFDRGLISIDDDYRVLISPRGLPVEFERLFRPERRLILPDRLEWRPHPTYLAWHREIIFKRSED